MVVKTRAISRQRPRTSASSSTFFDLTTRGIGNFLALETFDVLRVFFGRNQFVVAAADELQQVVEKLGDVGRADVMLEMQFADASTQVDPKIFVVEDAEVLVLALEEVEAVVVKGGSMNALTAEQFLDTIAHFGGGVVGVCQGEYLIGTRMALTNQTLNTMGQHRRLARARAGDHEHRTVDVLNGFALPIVWGERRRAGVRLHRRHWGSGYHLPGMWKDARRTDKWPGSRSNRNEVGNCGLTGVLVDFKNTESISLGINEVPLPAGAGHREFRKGDDSTQIQDCLCHFVETLNLEGANECVCARLRRRRFSRPLEQASSRTSSFDTPIGNRQALDFGKFPVKDAGVKIDGPLRIVSLYLKIDMPLVHN